MSGKIRGGQIKDESITDLDLSPNSVKASEMSSEAISGQDEITATDSTNDRLLIWDATDSALKKVAPENVGSTSNLIVSGAQADYSPLSVSNTSRITIDSLSGLFVEPDGANKIKIKVGSHFNPIAVSGQTDVSADGVSTLNFEAGDNMTITTNNSTKTITFAADNDGGVPAGSNGELQYNNNGSFGGATNLAWDAANSHLGIGTATPSQALDVIGNIRVSDNGNIYCDGSGELYLGNTAGGVVRIGGDGGTSTALASFNHLSLQTSRDEDDIFIKTGASTTTRLFVEGDSGKIGIGTNIPQTILHVNSSSNLPGEITISIENADITAGSPIGQITFSGTESSPNFATGAHIIGEASENWSVGNAEGTALLFCTKGNGTTGDPTERVKIDHNGNVGIGTTTPTVPLQIEGGTDASLSQGSGYFLMGAESGVNMVIDNNEIIARNNGASSTLYLNAPGGEVRLGNVYNNAGLTIDSSGYGKIDKGWKYSPSVQVSNGTSSDNNLWIKMASVTSVYQSKTSTSIFLVSITGWETSDNRNISANYLVTAKFTASNVAAGYDPEGTSIVIEALDSSDLEGFNPANDIVLTCTARGNAQDEDADIWISAKVKDKHIFVTHLGGTSNIEVGQSDKSFWILSGQSWTNAYTSLGNVIVGRWVDNKVRKLEVTDSASVAADFTVDTDTLHVDSSNNRVGIGTTSPAEELHVKGTDPRVRIEASAGNHPGVELSENGTRKWIMYNDPANDMLRYKAVSDTNDTFSFERIADGQGQLRLTQIAYTDGAGAIDILAGGALRFNNGVKASPGVKVNADLTTSDDQWIKIASTPYNGDDYDISSSTFLVTFVGVWYADSSPMRQRYMVSARVLADDDSDPYYELKGTDVLVTPLDADYLDGFDPTTDILLAIERDTTPKTDIWIKARQQYTDVYVTHLNGSTVDTLATDAGWEILSDQSWTADSPDTASYSIIYGDWTSRQMKNLYTSGAEFRAYTDASFSSSWLHQIPILPWINEIDTQPQRIILCADGGSYDSNGERVVQLPAQSNSDKRIITIKDADGSASSSNIRVTGFSSETIDGNGNYYISSDYGAITVICNGSGWLILSVV